MPCWVWLGAAWIAFDCAFVLLWASRPRERNQAASDDDEAATLAALAREQARERAARRDARGGLEDLDAP